MTNTLPPTRPRSRRAHNQRDEDGDTLVEIMITIVLVGLVVAAILGAIMIAIESSTTHRNLANDDTIVKSALEAVKDQVELPQSGTNDFVDCGTTSNGPSSILTAWTTVGGSKYITLPSIPGGYSESIGTVQCWDPNARTFDSTCTAVSPCVPSGVLLVSVTATDPSGYALTESTIVRNPSYQASYNGVF
jgi:type II secretory pathway pseudopilin PulG